MLLALGVKPAHAEPLAAANAAPRPQLAPQRPFSVLATDAAVRGGTAAVPDMTREIVGQRRRER